MTCFRLLMELYSFLRCKRFKPSDGNVTRISVSLRSYIHSYQHYKRIKRLSEFGFRLLAEYHSFLPLLRVCMKKL